MGKVRPGRASGERAAKARARQIEVQFLEGVRARLPVHPGVLESLGCLYTEMGRYEDGLQADRAMVKLQPSSSLAWYNLACSLSLTGQPDEAFAALDKAIGLGYADADWMIEDEDFAPIRGDPRFARVLAKIASRQAP